MQRRQCGEGRPSQQCASTFQGALELHEESGVRSHRPWRLRTSLDPDVLLIWQDMWRRDRLLYTTQFAIGTVDVALWDLSMPRA